MRGSVRCVAVRAGLVAAAVVLLCAGAGAGGAGSAQLPVVADRRRCGFDEMQARVMGTGVSLVSNAEVPAGERAVVSAAARPWLPIRIAVFTDDITNSSRHCTAAGQTRSDYGGGTVTCTAEDVLTKAKKQTLLELLIPSAVQLHRERLSVQREGSRVLLRRCVKRHPICGQFSIPASHMTTGVPDADFVFYISGGPTSGDTTAWARGCQYFVNGRPSVGVCNLSPKYITPNPQTVRVVAHELMHALGFNVHRFKAHKMFSVVSLRGKGASPVITSENVVAKVRAQYGCNTSAFMELEDAQRKGTARSHWKRRSAKDELMASVSGAGIYSAITIAAMEDLGYYRGNYSNAEPMAYGQNAGCTLATSKCVMNGVSQFPEMFCDEVNLDMRCSTDRVGMGRCRISTISTELPAYFQYFRNSRDVGSDALMDFCPEVEVHHKTTCIVNGKTLSGGLYGITSRCLDTSRGFYVDKRWQWQYGICADIQCGISTYSVRVVGSSAFTACRPGTVLPLRSLSSVFSGGSLTCPSYASVCAVKVDAALYGKYAALLADHSVGRVRAFAMAVVPVAVLLAVLLTA